MIIGIFIQSLRNNIIIIVLSIIFLAKLSYAAQFLRYNCSIADIKGKLIREFPGERCVYTNTGFVASGSQIELSKINAKGESLWKKRLNCHHTLRFIGNNLLVMQSSIHLYRGELTRFDRISLFDKSGNEIRYFDFYDHKDELLKLSAPEKRSYRGETYLSFRKPDEILSIEEKKNFVPVNVEFSHANSALVIPVNSMAKKNPAFNAGNIIVHVNGIGVMFILDAKLTKILWSLPTEIYESFKSLSMHDVQVLSDGNILIYNNNYLPNKSSIDQFNPLSMKTTHLYIGDENNHFFAYSQGGVQKLKNAHLLISEFNLPDKARVFEVNSEGKTLWSFNIPTNGLQEVKLEDLSEFLRQNRNPFGDAKTQGDK